MENGVHRAGLGRRLAAISLDWIMSYFIVVALTGGLGVSNGSRPASVLGLFFTEYLLLVGLSGASAGHRLLRLKVVSFPSGGQPTPLQALIRTVLMVLIVTAVTYDENGRGIHERLSGTATIKI